MKKKKNILFLLTDQQRFDTISLNGLTQCQTPYIDEVDANKKCLGGYFFIASR